MERLVSQDRLVRSTGRCLLVVMDEGPRRRGLAESFLLAGYDVLFVSEGAEAVTAARMEEPHVILLTPGCAGGEALAVLTCLKSDELAAEIPVLTLFGRGQREAALEGWRLGSDCCLTLPIYMEELVSYVNELSGHARQEDARQSQPEHARRGSTFGRFRDDLARSLEVGLPSPMPAKSANPDTPDA